MKRIPIYTEEDRVKIEKMAEWIVKLENNAIHSYIHSLNPNFVHPDIISIFNVGPVFDRIDIDRDYNNLNVEHLCEVRLISLFARKYGEDFIPEIRSFLSKLNVKTIINQYKDFEDALNWKFLESKSLEQHVTTKRSTSFHTGGHFATFPFTMVSDEEFRRVITMSQ